MNKYLLIIAVMAFSLSSAAIDKPTTVNQATIVDPGSEWLSYGRTYREQRFSPLNEINRGGR